MEQKKVALVTGASSGIGKAVYDRLAAEGWTVYGTSRKAEKGIAVKKGGGYMLYMDVTDEASVKESIGIIMAAEGRLDALINNAGYGIAGSVEDTSIEEAREMFNVNFFGYLSTIRAAFAFLEESRGIIVNISSVAAILTVPYQGIYCAGKSAVEAMSRALRLEAKPYGVRVCSVEPGDTKTNYTYNKVWAEATEGSKYEKTARRSVGKMEHDEQNGVPPEDVAKLVYKIIKRKNPPVRCAVGFSYRILLFLDRLLPNKLVMWIVEQLYA